MTKNVRMIIACAVVLGCDVDEEASLDMAEYADDPRWPRASDHADGCAAERSTAIPPFGGPEDLKDASHISALAQWFDATDSEIADSGWSFSDVNSVDWAQAGRAATGICNKRGFVGGFFNGHQIPGKRGLVCVL